MIRGSSKCSNTGSTAAISENKKQDMFMISENEKQDMFSIWEKEK